MNSLGNKTASLSGLASGEEQIGEPMSYENSFVKIDEKSDGGNKMNDELISRQAAIDSLLEALYDLDENDFVDKVFIEEELKRVPSIQFEKEIAKRVLWTGWKGIRNTRYKCPNCKKQVKNDDVYCHRCGQKLMFPHISFTDYIPGEKQELIVRWDDE